MTSAEEIREAFRQCMPLFIALGDEVRLSIINALSGAALNRKGLNVNEITQKTKLSRPAVSHHLKILREAGLVDMRPLGTANYYYLTIAECTQTLMNLGFRLQEFIQ